MSRNTKFFTGLSRERSTKQRGDLSFLAFASCCARLPSRFTGRIEAIEDARPRIFRTDCDAALLLLFSVDVFVFTMARARTCVRFFFTRTMWRVFRCFPLLFSVASTSWSFSKFSKKCGVERMKEAKPKDGINEGQGEVIVSPSMTEFRQSASIYIRSQKGEA